MVIYQSAVKCSLGQVDRQIMCNLACKCRSFEYFISFSRLKNKPKVHET